MEPTREGIGPFVRYLLGRYQWRARDANVPRESEDSSAIVAEHGRSTRARVPGGFRSISKYGFNILSHETKFHTEIPLKDCTIRPTSGRYNK